MTFAVRVTKRAIDIVGASIGVVVTAPLISAAVVVLGVEALGGWRHLVVKKKRASQPRETRGGSGKELEFGEFSMLKLRIDREPTSGEGPLPERPSGRIAQLLRRARLDELPQLINVLRGEMSLVGPRPERPEVMKILSAEFPFFEESLRDLKPGMTGLGRVTMLSSDRIPADGVLENAATGTPSGALDDDLQAKLFLDLKYAAAMETFSEFLSLELGILAHTPITLMQKLMS